MTNTLEQDIAELREVVQQAFSIIETLHKENQAYIETLKRINSCDDSATQHSREAHEVLKRFGKL